MPNSREIEESYCSVIADLEKRRAEIDMLIKCLDEFRVAGLRVGRGLWSLPKAEQRPTKEVVGPVETVPQSTGEVEYFVEHKDFDIEGAKWFTLASLDPRYEEQVDINNIKNGKMRYRKQAKGDVPAGPWIEGSPPGGWRDEE